MTEPTRPLPSTVEHVEPQTGHSPDTLPAAEMSAAPPLPLGPPARSGDLGTLGPYRLLEVLGRGGMGAVFRAEDPKLRRQVALKVMLPEVAANPHAKDRFVREARAQAAVEHDHIIPIHQVDDGDTPYLTMPLLKGQSLAAALKKHRRPPLPEVCRVGREIASGLAAAHAVGLIHRDIKPGNVWLEGDQRRVKILDFGLARAASDTPDRPSPAATQLGSGPDVTRAGAVVGTPAYMAPEQAAGKPVDHRADVWSLGVVLFEMACGRLPFTGTTVFELLANVIAAPVPRMLARIPGPLSELIRVMLSKEPTDRPTAAVVADALQVIELGLSEVEVVPLDSAPEARSDVWVGVADSIAGPVPAPEVWSRRRWLGVAALGGTAVVTIAGGAVVWKRVRPAPETADPVPAVARERPPAALPVPAARPEGRWAGFREARGLTADGLVAWAAGLPAGYGPVSVAPRSGTAPRLFDAVAVPVPGAADWRIELHPLDRSRDVLNEGIAEGLLPIHRFIYPSAGQPRGGCVFARIRGTGTRPMWAGGLAPGEYRWFAYGQGAPAVTARMLDRDRASGRWPAVLRSADTGPVGGDLDVYLTRAAPVGMRWEVVRELTADGLTAAAATARSNGRWPVGVSARMDATPPRYLAVFRDTDTGLEWELQTEVGEAEFETGLPARDAAGLQPASLQAVVIGGRPLYTAVWVRRPGPADLTPAQRRAVQWVLDFGGRLEAEDVAGQVVELAAGAALPGGAISLRTVTLWELGRFDDTAVVNLTDCPPVAEQLNFYGCRLSDAGVERLVGLPVARDCVHVCLNLNPVTDAALRHLARLPRLERLHLMGCRDITGRGLSHFAAHPRLTEVNLNACSAVAPELVDHLRPHPLRKLMVGWVQAADAIADRAAGLPRVAELEFENADLTDTGLTHLSRCVGLTRLNVRGTRVTREAVTRFAATRPGCRIEWDGGVIEPTQK